jgi:KTSC domain
MEMKPVYSSHVREIGHDPATGELVVVWQSGRRSVYKGVGAEKADRVMRAASVGEALHREVKGVHEHEYRG